MGKTYKDSSKEKGFSKPKTKAKKTNTKEKRPNKSFDYLTSSDYD